MESESSIHGVNFIFNSRTSKFSRFFWSFALFTSFLGFSYYIFIAYMKFHFNPDVVLKISQRPLYDIPFPAFTICSPVVARRSVFSFRDEEDEDFTLKKSYFNHTEKCKFVLANAHWCHFGNVGWISVFCNQKPGEDGKQALNYLINSIKFPSRFFTSV